jgi:hypothetical protein
VQLMPCEVLGRYSLVADWSCPRKYQAAPAAEYRNWTRIKADMTGANGSVASDWGTINGRRQIHLKRGDVVRDKAPFKYFDLVRLHTGELSLRLSARLSHSLCLC